MRPSAPRTWLVESPMAGVPGTTRPATTAPLHRLTPAHTRTQTQQMGEERAGGAAGSGPVLLNLLQVRVGESASGRDCGRLVEGERGPPVCEIRVPGLSQALCNMCHCVFPIYPCRACTCILPNSPRDYVYLCLSSKASYLVYACVLLL